MDIIWSSDTHCPGLVALNTLLATSFPLQGTLVMAPKAHPAQTGGSTLARCLGILPIWTRILIFGNDRCPGDSDNVWVLPVYLKERERVVLCESYLGKGQRSTGQHALSWTCPSSWLVCPLRYCWAKRFRQLQRLPQRLPFEVGTQQEILIGNVFFTVSRRFLIVWTL